MWIEAQVNTTIEPAHQPKQPLLQDQAKSKLFAQHESRWRETVHYNLEHYLAIGKTAIWGAGAKGVTFLNLIDPDRAYIDFVIDVNPNKIGNFLPGTGHEIVSIEAIAQRGISTVIVMNPNYIDENKSLIAKHQIDVKLISIEEWSVNEP